MKVLGSLVRLYFVLSFALASQSTYAQKYVSGRVPGTLTLLYDDTIKISQAIAIDRPFSVQQAWFRQLEASTETRWEKSTKMLISVSCELEKMAILKVIVTTPNNDTGDDFGQDDRQENYDHVVPDSVGFNMMMALCDR